MRRTENGEHFGEDRHLAERQLEIAAFWDAPALRSDAAVASHLETCHVCSARVATLRAKRASFLESRPPSVFLAELREHAKSNTAPTSFFNRVLQSRRWVLAATAAVLVAGLATMLLLTRGEGRDAVHSTYRGISLKGGEDATVGVSLYVSRNGRDAVPWIRGEPLYRGDILKFGVRSEKDGYVTIVNVDDNGTVSLYYPIGNRAPARVTASKTTVLGGSIVLDDFIGEELIVSFVTSKPISTKSLLDAVRAAVARANGQLSKLSFGGIDAAVGTARIRKARP